MQKDGEDAIKKKQLQDLAILNGTYRHPCSSEGSPPPATAAVTQNGGMENVLQYF